MKKSLVLLTFLFAFIVHASAQVTSVTGTVVSADDGEPVIGATVMVKGTKAVAITDANGKFAISQGIGGGKILVVTYVGMKTVEVTLRPNMRIVMEPETANVDEVIVTAFGQQTRSSFTGSAAVVDSKKIEKKQLTNVIAGLRGEVPGVQITGSSGSPTSTPVLRIRGFSSINAGKDPLIIVDGSPYDGGWNNLNPNDVASVTVLKDAASNALYGARGANGVIMITTKKAEAGKATITLDAKWGVNSRIKRDYDYISDPGQYYETWYKALYNYQTNVLGQTHYQAHVNANTIMASDDKSSGGLGYMVYTVPDGEYVIGENGKLNPHATLGSRVYNNGQVYTLYPDDWKEAAFRNGLRQEYNLSVTGKTDRADFYAGLGYLNNEGIANGSFFERYTARLKADYKANNWLRIGGNANFTHSSYKYFNTSSFSGLFYSVSIIAPIYPLYIRDGNGNIMTDSNGLMYDYGDGAENGLTRPINSGLNAVQENQLNASDCVNNVLTFTGFSDINLLKDLKLTLNGTGTFYHSLATYTYNPYYGYYATTYPTGAVSKSTSMTYSYNFQQLLNYSHDFGNHHMELMLGHEYYYRDYYYLAGERETMVDYFGIQNLSGAITVLDADDSETEYNNEGYFFRGQYDYKQKYFGSVSFRRDASSRFHPDHRWGNFFSLGGAWIMTKESWLNSIDWLQTLKLKASFGQQGNDDISNFLYTDYYSIKNDNGTIGLTLSHTGNEYITWETNNNFNVGVEFEMFKSRLRGSLEYFYRKTTDMLTSVSVAYSSGIGSIWYNVGDMVNKGFEIDLSGDVIHTKDLVWTLNFNTTHYKNEITNLYDDKKSLSLNGHDGFYSGNKYYGEGLPLYTWYLKRYAGVAEDGQALYYTSDGNGNITGTTTVYGNAGYFLCGDPHPDLYGGFGTSLSYGGFDLSVTFSYSLGGMAYDYTYQTAMSNPPTGGVGYAIHKDILNAWTADNTDSNIPRWQFGDTYSAGTSDRFLTDSSYLTLQNINLGYNLPKKWVVRCGLSGVRVYMAGDNLYYWSKRKGFDPRGSLSGQSDTSRYSYSTSRCVSGGIKVNF